MALIQFYLLLFFIGNVLCMPDTNKIYHHLVKRSTRITQVRLVNGSSSYEGRVEVYLNGGWGSICDDLWNEADARVVCRMLRMSTDSAQPVGGARYGQATGPIKMDDVRCNGTENSLDECQYTPGTRHDCRHSEDAGVICYPYASIAVMTKSQLEGALLNLRAEGGQLEQYAIDFHEKAADTYSAVDGVQTISNDEPIEDNPGSCPSIECPANCPNSERLHINHSNQCPVCECREVTTQEPDNFNGDAVTTTCPPLECVACPDGSMQAHDYGSACPYCYCAQETNSSETFSPGWHKTTACPPVHCPVCPHGFKQEHVTNAYCPYCHCSRRLEDQPTTGDYWRVTCPQPKCPVCNNDETTVWDYTKHCPTCSCTNGSHDNNDVGSLWPHSYPTNNPGRWSCQQLPVCPTCAYGSFQRYYVDYHGCVSYCYCATPVTSWYTTARRDVSCPQASCPSCSPGYFQRWQTNSACPYCYCQRTASTAYLWTSTNKGTSAYRTRGWATYGVTTQYLRRTTPSYWAGSTPRYSTSTTQPYWARTTPRYSASTTQPYWARSTRPYWTRTTTTYWARTTPPYWARTTQPYWARTTPPYWARTTPPYWARSTLPSRRTTANRCLEFRCPACYQGYINDVYTVGGCFYCSCKKAPTTSARYNRGTTVAYGCPSSACPACQPGTVQTREYVGPCSICYCAYEGYTTDTYATTPNYQANTGWWTTDSWRTQSRCPNYGCPYCGYGFHERWYYSGMCSYCSCEQDDTLTTASSQCPPTSCPSCPENFVPDIYHGSACPVCYCHPQSGTTPSTFSGLRKQDVLRDIEILQSRLQSLQNFTQLVAEELSRLQFQLQSATYVMDG